MAQRMTTPEVISAYRTEEIQERFGAKRESMSKISEIKLSSVKAWSLIWSTARRRSQPGCTGDSPIADISNTQKIDRVIYQGEIIDRDG